MASSGPGPGKGKLQKESEKSKPAKDGGEAAPASLKRKRGLFARDLKPMMYGFGDDSNPMQESIELVEDIVVEYITEMVHKSAEVAAHRGRMQTEDFMFLVRKEPAKLRRVQELLSMNEELKRARKAFEVDEAKEVE